MKLRITHIDTACCLLEIGGSHILTDPALDPPGGLYHHGFGAFSRKTSTPAILHESLPEPDLVLLSHDQHKDNLDREGRSLLGRCGKILSTAAAAGRLRNCAGLNNWESAEHTLKDGSRLRITATPAQHHPWWLPEFFSGPVIGFMLEHERFGKPLYISGDTVYFSGIADIRRRWQPGLALLHVGSAQFRYLSGPGRYTMNARDYSRSVRTLAPETAIPIHNGGWTHFRENNASLAKALEAQPDVDKCTRFLEPGVALEIDA